MVDLPYGFRTKSKINRILFSIKLKAMLKMTQNAV